MAGKVYYYYLLMMITWMWVVLLLQNHHLVDSSKLEKDALLTLLYHTKQKPEVKDNWTTHANTCDWLGVTCDKNERVKFLNLPGKSFIGPIPNNTIGALTKLRVLSLPFNGFKGTLPSDFSKLILLRTLNLRSNEFEGEFPLLITRLRLLKFVDLALNNFKGQIPCEIQNMPILLQLRLEDNNFTGILRGLHLRKSVNFSVANNNFTGPVPTTLSELPREAFDGNPLMCGYPLSSKCNNSTTDEYNFSNMTYCPPLDSQPNPVVATFAMSGGAALFLLLFLIILLFPVRRKHRPTNNSDDKIQVKSQSNSSSQQRRKLVIFPENNPNSSNTTDSSWANGIDAKEIMSGRSEPMKPGPLTKGIGKSYKVELLMTDKALVVKHLMDPEAVASDELDFSNKMEFLGKIRWHENVMPLRGYCIYEEEYLMIYDFIPGGSLYDCLHGSDPLELDWESRKKIALDAARGLVHLHKEVKLAHGNIKSSNILLLGKNPLEVYVADYGLTATPPTSYYGPETTVPTNIKADVYAYGVLLLELLTGKSPDDTNLVQEMQSSSAQGGASDDEKKKMDLVCLLQIAKRCTHEAADERPEMEKVARMIEDISKEDEIEYGPAAPVEEQSHEISEDSWIHPGTPPPPASTP